jgi:Zn-dependent protease with chaperone function
MLRAPMHRRSRDSSSPLAEPRRRAAALRLMVPIIVLAAAAIAATAARPAPLASASALAASAAPAEAIPAAAANDYLGQVHARYSPENRAYSDRKTLMRLLSPFYTVVVALLLLVTGLSARLRDVAHAIASRRYLRVLVYLVLLTVVLFVLNFPFAWYDDFALEHRFGLSSQPFPAWLGDQVKTAVVGVVLLGLVPLLWLVYTAITRSPRRWWLWLAAGTLPVIVIGILIQPILIDPLFNRFTPLRDRHLEARILALAQRADIPGRNVYQVDKSEQTKKYNAYVSGFGASQRIVLWDTMLRGMNEDEIVFVMGHEMGHYKLGHIWRGIAFTVAVSVLLYFLSARVAEALLRRSRGRWGFHELHDVASMPLLMISLSLVLFVTQPLIHAYGRGIETEADRYGLELTRDSDAAARAFIKLASHNRSDPEPPAWIKWLLYSHPPDAERVRLATHYHPWDQGRPNRYFRAKT